MAEAIEKLEAKSSDECFETTGSRCRKVQRASLKSPLPWVVAICSLVVLVAALFCWHIASGATQLDAGATVSNYEGMTREEIKAELNKIALENRMIVSVSSRMALHDDGLLRINAVNDESNRFHQRFVLIQDGETVYESGAVEPGKAIELCHASGAKEGKATLEIQAVDSETLDDQGSPTRVSVDIVRATK